MLGTFLSVAALEITRPWRPVKTFAAVRWASNLALLLLTWGLDFLLAPIIVIVAAAGWEGGLPLWVQLAVGVPALDAASYALHRLFHASTVLWRLHALHHADPELDISTAVRHHPGELLLMALAIAALGTAIGLPALVIGVYASLNISVQLLAHANIGLPKRLASCLGWLVVTPNLHRVHHSRHPADVAANYGLVFSVWTVCSAPTAANPKMVRTPSSSELIAFASSIFSGLTGSLLLPLIAR